uniref:Uncharacterized protein n=1 Tax=Rousettus aegyptiacus TaxID=9407 RepID=A0A7J8EZR2_ROUAE|nr:hypothetical protein HJG63_012219 [Rousettus aegyptiacus]
MELLSDTKTETQKSSKTWPTVTQLVCGRAGIHPQVLLDLQATFLNTGLSRFMQGACLSPQLQLSSSPPPTTLSSSHTELLVLLGPHCATSYLPALAHAGLSAWHTCPPFPWPCLQTPAESLDTPFDAPGLDAVTTAWSCRWPCMRLYL